MPPARRAERPGATRTAADGQRASEDDEEEDPGDSEALEHPVGIVIISHSPPAGIRFSIKKEFFQDDRSYGVMPDRIFATIQRWVDAQLASYEVVL